MIISDLNYLESIQEDLNVEGAGDATAFIYRTAGVRAQREAYYNLDTDLQVEAVGEVKYITFFDRQTAKAYT